MASGSLIKLLDKVQCLQGTGNWTYGDAVALQDRQTDFLLVGKCICESVTVTLKYKVEHSPDGVRWSPLLDSSGAAIEFQCVSTTAGAAVQTCAIKIADTPILPFIRGICGEADVSATCECTLDLHYTTFK